MLSPFGNELWQTVQGLWAENDIDVGGACNDCRPFLAGDAAADTDDQVGLCQLERTNPAEIVKNTFLCFFAHGAGVEQDDVGVFCGVRLDDVFRGCEYVKHFVRVVLVHLAPKGADEQFFYHCELFSFLKRRDFGRADHPYAVNCAGGIGDIDDVFFVLYGHGHDDQVFLVAELDRR